MGSSVEPCGVDEPRFLGAFDLGAEVRVVLVHVLASVERALLFSFAA